MTKHQHRSPGEPKRTVTQGDVAGALEILSNVLYLMEIDCDNPENVVMYVGIAQTAIHTLYKMFAELPENR